MKQVDPIQSLVDNIRTRERIDEVVREFILQYYRDMNEVELRFLSNDLRSEEEEISNLHLAIAAKLAVHRRYWAESVDNFWEPCSASSREEYRISDIQFIKIMSDHRSSFLAEVRYPLVVTGPGFQDAMYLIEYRTKGSSGRLFIVNRFT